jgi:3-hydroxyisobutyrate dehydrogenase-like beta-hydroxyacid dehydrogenase
VRNLGFVGLGVMGSRIAERLLEAGYRVTGWNRTRAKAEWLIERGLRWADSPRDVALASDVAFTMVADTRALRQVTGGEHGLLAGMGEGKVYVDMSTVSPAASRDLAQRVRRTGARMLDAPVSGSVGTLEEGRLSLMVGGDKGTFDRVRPVLKDIGPTVTHMGPNGHGSLMKIATNLGLAVQMLAFSEAVLLAEKGGITRETAVHVLINSAVASPMVRYRGPFVLRQPDEAWFDVRMMQKDLRLAMEAALELDVPLPTTALSNEFLTAARGMGLAHHDFAIVFDVLASMAGVDVHRDRGEG